MLKEYLVKFDSGEEKPLTIEFFPYENEYRGGVILKFLKANQDKRQHPYIAGGIEASGSTLQDVLDEIEAKIENLIPDRPFHIELKN